MRRVLLVVMIFWASSAFAQVSATLSGIVTDPSDAAVVSAGVTAKEVDTGITRTTTTNDAGRYDLFELPVGLYEIHVRKQGFSEGVRTGIQLVVGQEAIVNLALRLGQVEEQVTVNENAPIVSTTTSDISGLVGEQQMKDLPLNGRSYDLLLPLNPGVVNFTMQKTGGTGISNSTNGNNFAVSGNRPQQNIFLLNGVEYTGAAENNMQPASTSGELLGVESVREFNVLRDSYGAEYGKRPGGQVVIVTKSGTNQWHGSAYEFLRNNVLDARNYFDPDGASAPPFRRNQFGAAMGGADPHRQDICVCELRRTETILEPDIEHFRASSRFARRHICQVRIRVHGGAAGCMCTKGAAIAELVARAERTGTCPSRRWPQRHCAVYRECTANHSRGLRHGPCGPRIFSKRQPQRDLHR